MPDWMGNRRFGQMRSLCCQQSALVSWTLPAMGMRRTSMLARTWHFDYKVTNLNFGENQLAPSSDWYNFVYLSFAVWSAQSHSATLHAPGAGLTGGSQLRVETF